MLGTITAVENDGYSHIEVEYPISQFISQVLFVFAFFFLVVLGRDNSNIALQYIPGFMLYHPRAASQFVFLELRIDISLYLGSRSTFMILAEVHDFRQ
jgi:hypothetical protein